MNKQARFHIGYWIAAILGIMVIQYVYVTTQQIAPIPYSQFQQLLRDGKVAEIGVSDRYIQGKLKEPLPDGKSQFVTTRVDPQFADELQKYGVTYTGQVESTLLRDLLSWIVPVALFFGVWTFLARRMSQGLGGGLMSIGKSKAKIYVETDTGRSLRGRGRRRRGEGGAAGDRRVPEEPRAVRPIGRAHAERRAAGRTARHRQDAARQGGGRRGQGAVLLDLRLRVRRDVRRRRRRAGARPVRAGENQGAGHHLHRRARCARPRPRHRPLRGRSRREGADAQPAPRRDGRLRFARPAW